MKNTVVRVSRDTLDKLKQVNISRVEVDELPDCITLGMKINVLIQLYSKIFDRPMSDVPKVYGICREVAKRLLEVCDDMGISVEELITQLLMFTYVPSVLKAFNIPLDEIDGIDYYTVRLKGLKKREVKLVEKDRRVRESLFSEEGGIPEFRAYSSK